MIQVGVTESTKKDIENLGVNGNVNEKGGEPYE